VTLSDHLIYALLWLSFGTVHSFLAARAVKASLTGLLGGGYRLAYNIFAAIHIGAVMVAGRLFLASGAEQYPFEGIPAMALNAALVLGVIVLIAALLEYDLGRFSGFTQLRAGREGGNITEDEPLVFTGLHQYVRHPLYSGAFLLLFSGSWNEFSFATAVWGSLYLVIGTWFEERKLVRLYGEAYRHYRRQVPAFFPWKGRVEIAGPDTAP
jgi:methanethiol S-methyltransferase